MEAEAYVAGQHSPQAKWSSVAQYLSHLLLDNGVIDEIPGAYKDIDAVMECQRDAAYRQTSGVREGVVWRRLQGKAWIREIW